MASETKRKKTFTKKETLEKLKECENRVKKAVEVILSELSPFDVTDENITCYEERLDRLEKVSSSLTRRIYRLKEDVKAKRFRRNQDLLEEDMISCSHFRVLQSEDKEEETIDIDLHRDRGSGRKLILGRVIMMNTAINLSHYKLDFYYPAQITKF